MHKMIQAAFLSIILPSASWGLGLGEIATDTALNQPLRAEIDLRWVNPEDIGRTRVQLAPQAAFTKAGIERSDVLKQLEFAPSIKNGKPVILITSQHPIREPLLSFLVEVEGPGGHLVREYTVFLDPPGFANTRNARSPIDSQENQLAKNITKVSFPQPKAENTPAPGNPQPGAPQISLSGGAPNKHIVRPGETLRRIAGKVAPSSAVSVEQMTSALLRANPEAFSGGNINRLKVGAVLRVPTREEIEGITQTQSQALVNPQSAPQQQAKGPATEPEALAPATSTNLKSGEDKQATGQASVLAQDVGQAQLPEHMAKNNTTASAEVKSESTVPAQPALTALHAQEDGALPSQDTRLADSTANLSDADLSNAQSTVVESGPAATGFNNDATPQALAKLQDIDNLRSSQTALAETKPIGLLESLMTNTLMVLLLGGGASLIVMLLWFAVVQRKRRTAQGEEGEAAHLEDQTSDLKTFDLNPEQDSAYVFPVVEDAPAIGNVQDNRPVQGGSVADGFFKQPEVTVKNRLDSSRNGLAQIAAGSGQADVDEVPVTHISTPAPATPVTDEVIKLLSLQSQDENGLPTADVAWDSSIGTDDSQIEAPKTVNQNPTADLFGFAVPDLDLSDSSDHQAVTAGEPSLEVDLSGVELSELNFSESQAKAPTSKEVKLEGPIFKAGDDAQIINLIDDAPEIDLGAAGDDSLVLGALEADAADPVSASLLESLAFNLSEDEHPLSTAKTQALEDVSLDEITPLPQADESVWPMVVDAPTVNLDPYAQQEPPLALKPQDSRSAELTPDEPTRKIDFDPEAFKAGGTADLATDLAEPAWLLTDEELNELMAGTETNGISVKLDLAQAYLDIGNREGACSILEEVMEDGDAQQRQQAEVLLGKIA